MMSKLSFANLRNNNDNVILSSQFTSRFIYLLLLCSCFWCIISVSFMLSSWPSTSIVNQENPLPLLLLGGREKFKSGRKLSDGEKDESKVATGMVRKSNKKVVNQKEEKYTPKLATEAVSVRAKKLKSRQPQQIAEVNTLSLLAPSSSSVRPRSPLSPEMSSPKIPRRLIFTSKKNILQTKKPTDMYENILNTIHLYVNAWSSNNQNGTDGTNTGSNVVDIEDSNTKINVMFLDDAHCIQEIINTSERKLLEYFMTVGKGMLRADICRVAALYNHGGYYFDVDMQAVEPVLLDHNVSFSSIYQPDGEGFFQSFLASESHHPILKQAMKEMTDIYEKKKKGCDNMGVCSMQDAYDAVNPEDRGVTRMFKESDYDIAYLMYESQLKRVPRQKGYGGCCNYLVLDDNNYHQNDNSENANSIPVYFFSRFVGASHCCQPGTENSANFARQAFNNLRRAKGFKGQSALLEKIKAKSALMMDRP